MRCAEHPQVEAVGVCQVCGRGVCSQCQRSVSGRTICYSCMTELQRAGLRQEPSGQGFVKQQSGCLTFLLGLIPGLGHLYLGHTHKGLVLMLLGVGLLYLFMVVPIALTLFGILVAYSAFDSLNTVRKISSGIPVSDWSFAQEAASEIKKSIATTASLKIAWTLYLGTGVGFIGLLVLVDALSMVSRYPFAALRDFETAGRVLVSVAFVLLGGYLLWKGFHAQESL